jgi:hypothetical protein
MQEVGWAMVSDAMASISTAFVLIRLGAVGIIADNVLGIVAM